MTFQTFTDQFTDLVNLPRFSNIGTDTTDTGYEVKEIAQQSGEEIMRRVDWPNLVFQGSALVSADSLSLPPEFHRLIDGGAVTIGGTTQFVRLAPGDMHQYLKNSASAQPYYFMEPGVIFFVPPAPVGGINIQYVSRFWVKALGATPTDTLTDGADTIEFPETLMVKCMLYRWRRQNGVEYGDHLAEFEADLLTEANAARGITA
jgi:hypothetical protein